MTRTSNLLRHNGAPIPSWDIQYNRVKLYIHSIVKRFLSKEIIWCQQDLKSDVRLSHILFRGLQTAIRALNQLSYNNIAILMILSFFWECTFCNFLLYFCLNCLCMYIKCISLYIWGQYSICCKTRGDQQCIFDYFRWGQWTLGGWEATEGDNRHCGLVVSTPAWDGTGCEFDSWQGRIYIPCSLSLRLLGSLRGSLGTYGLTQKLC